MSSLTPHFFLYSPERLADFVWRVDMKNIRLEPNKNEAMRYHGGIRPGLALAYSNRGALSSYVL